MNEFKRKVKKALKDPKWAIKRSLSLSKEIYTKKRTKDDKKFPVLRNSGYSQYTVVSAVYNVEKYLDEYFESLVNQTLDFTKHIHLILVDDGSTDSSAEIIKKWQAQYPNNITYLYKENGGISSARNFGVKHVKTEWVTFIDSDDFVSPNYFQLIDETIEKDSSIEMVVGNLYYYHDKTKVASDTHPLKYRFKDNVTKIPVTNMDNYVNLFVTVTFFKMKHLRNSGLEFDSKIKPHFEDGKYLADYLLYVYQGNIAYVKNAIFYYRKRGDGNSTIDTAWLKKEKFFDLLYYGYLALLKEHQIKLGFIPKNIQWTVIMDLAWHVKELFNQPGRMVLANLTEEEKQRYYSLVKECLSYIDSKYIKEFNMIDIWEMHRIGMLGLKNEKPDSYTAFVENIDIAKKQILVCYFCTIEVVSSFKLNGVDTIPKFIKTVRNTMGDMSFVMEKRCWIPYASEDDILSVEIDFKETKISIWNKHYNTISIGDILKKYHQPATKYASDGSWVLMDRDVQADDNAEHLYRFLKQNYPEQECYFALNYDSHDWKRLEDEGFNLIPFGTPNFEKHLKKAEKIISSHFDGYIQNYFKDEYDHSKKFVLLQHGVVHNDMSNVLMYKRNMLCMVTTTQAEYDAFVSDTSTYQVGKKEVVLTGLPRHDALVTSTSDTENVILVMPTWRNYILGDQIGKGNGRQLNEQFMETEYAKHWTNLLKSEKLAEMAKNYGYKVIFAPHKNIEPYLPVMNLPDYISLWSADKSGESIQNLFKRAKLMITDYSSVAFEMGFLQKLVLYYQFDYKTVFSGRHISQKGYFSYENDGFGPVSEREDELLNHLLQALENSEKAVVPYRDRIEKTFLFRDGKNSERVYQAIKNLDVLDNSVDIGILKQYTQQAYDSGHWSLLRERSKMLIEYGTAEDKALALELRLKALAAEEQRVLREYSLTEDELAKFNKMDIPVLTLWREFKRTHQI